MSLCPKAVQDNMFRPQRIRDGSSRPLFGESELELFAEADFAADGDQSEFYNVLRPILGRFVELPEDERSELRGALQEYVRK